MVYGAEVVLLVDIAFRSARVENFDEDKANEVWELEVNSVEEKRLDSSYVQPNTLLFCIGTTTRTLRSGPSWSGTWS